MLSHYVISSVIGITVIIYIINSIRINIIAIIIDVIGSMLKEDLSADLQRSFEMFPLSVTSSL